MKVSTKSRPQNKTEQSFRGTYGNTRPSWYQLERVQRASTLCWQTKGLANLGSAKLSPSTEDTAVSSPAGGTAAEVDTAHGDVETQGGSSEGM